jgi:hypothetical protein
MKRAVWRAPVPQPDSSTSQVFFVLYRRDPTRPFPADAPPGEGPRYANFHCRIWYLCWNLTIFLQMQGITLTDYCDKIYDALL